MSSPWLDDETRVDLPSSTNMSILLVVIPFIPPVHIELSQSDGQRGMISVGMHYAVQWQPRGPLLAELMSVAVAHCTSLHLEHDHEHALPIICLLHDTDGQFLTDTGHHLFRGSNDEITICATQESRKVTASTLGTRPLRSKRQTPSDTKAVCGSSGRGACPQHSPFRDRISIHIK
ncbi:hypothetical protein CERZMDRAFT_83718 [Cercospora zeae-maydis SCOH1-5]|uniref:Uncharacterized protein n=1 Tax=Cercospora zeae-maydis SCOH1-5 TaxID=717836 RepID=A0A6A6FJW8_9PEZI|nr:hypothetical protein CERZMDRAFT_83718 [Cercospora zeae-maydis SCOH1-5]